MRAFAVILALATSAYAAPHARTKPGIREVFGAARRECARPGARLTSLVARVFDPAAFSAAVVADWVARSTDEQAAFVELADRVVGGEERADAIAAICVPGARIASAWEQGTNLWFVKVHRPGFDECTSLMFRDEGDRWSYDGVWFCGVSIWMQEWRRKLGGGTGRPDYATALARLHQRDAR